MFLGGTKMKSMLLALVIALSVGFCLTGCKKEEPALPEVPDVPAPPDVPELPAE